MKPQYPLIIGSVACVFATLLFSISPIIGQTDSTPPEEVVVSPPTTPSPVSADDATAQSEQEGPPITIYFGDGSAVAAFTKGGVTQNVQIHPGEGVVVQVAFPTEAAGQSVIIQALDGGTLATSEDNVTVNSEGLATFSFTADAKSGLYRVFVKVGDSTSTIQFWIPIPTDDSANPPVITPES